MTPPVAKTPEQLATEADRLTQMLRARAVARIWRHRPGELGIEFADGARMFVDCKQDVLEVSVTGSDE